VSTSTSRHESERFRCDVEPNRDSVRIVPFGELDMGTVGELETRLLELQQNGFREVELDLRNLTFMDSSGVHLIVAAERLARRDGTSFVVIAASPPVQRLFEIAGIEEMLRFRAA
jgi:anti-anti-sigma factor